MQPQPTPAQMVFSLIALALLVAILATWVWAIARLASGRLLPPASARPVPWNGKHVLGVVVLYVGLSIVVPLGMRAAGLIRIVPGQPPGPGLLLLVMMATNVAFLAIAPAALSAWSGAGRDDFLGARGRSGVDLLRGVVAWPLLVPVVFGASWLSLKIWSRERHPMETFLQDSASPLDLVFAAASAVVIAPLAEEFFFRGVLLGWLDRLILRPRPVRTSPPIEGITFLDVPDDPWADPAPPMPVVEEPPGPGRGRALLAANVLVSLLFAGIHSPVWPTPVPIFFLSLGLGLLYQRTGGLVAPIALHATFNGVSTALMILQVVVGDPRAKKGPDVEDFVPPGIVARVAEPVGSHVIGRVGGKLESGPDFGGQPPPARIDFCDLDDRDDAVPVSGELDRLASQACDDVRQTGL